MERLSMPPAHRHDTWRLWHNGRHFADDRHFYCILSTPCGVDFIECKLLYLCSKLHWNLFTGVQLQKCIVGRGNDFVPNRRQSIIWTNDNQSLSMPYGPRQTTMSLRVIAFLTICLTILTHWGCVMHICVGNLTIIGSDNGFSHGRHQAIIWTKAGIC